MSSQKTAITVLATLLVLLVAASEHYTLADNRKPFARSLYLPVTFKLCANLDQGVLYEGLRPVAPLPFRRVYQFTYYMERHRFVPESFQMDLIARNAAIVKTLRASFTVSLTEIRMGNQVLHQTTAKEIENQLSRRMDAHFKEVTLRFHCREADTCEGGCPSEQLEEPSASEDQDGQR